MASTGPTLLTIPREVRDNIYSYLDRKVSIFYRFGNDHTMFARAENTPLFNIQLVHTPLRREYRSADCFRKSSVSLTLFARTPYLAEQEVEYAHFDAMLSAMQHITYLANADSIPRLSDEDSTAIENITTAYPGLESLRLIIKEPLETLRLSALIQVLPLQLVTPVQQVTAPELAINRVCILTHCVHSLQVEDTRRLAYRGFRSRYTRTYQISRFVVYLYAIDGLEWCPNPIQDLGGRLLPVSHHDIQLASLSE